MQRMWRRGSDLRIAPGCVEPFLSDPRIVVEMDEIVGYAWMTRLAFENRL